MKSVIDVEAPVTATVKATPRPMPSAEVYAPTSIICASYTRTWICYYILIFVCGVNQFYFDGFPFRDESFTVIERCTRHAKRRQRRRRRRRDGNGAAETIDAVRRRDRSRSDSNEQMVLTLGEEEMTTLVEKEVENESDVVRHLCTHMFLQCVV